MKKFHNHFILNTYEENYCIAVNGFGIDSNKWQILKYYSIHLTVNVRNNWI